MWEHVAGGIEENRRNIVKIIDIQSTFELCVSRVQVKALPCEPARQVYFCLSCCRARRAESCKVPAVCVCVCVCVLGPVLRLAAVIDCSGNKVTRHL